MGETMNSPKGVTSGVPERAFPTRRELPPNNWKPVLCHS